MLALGAVGQGFLQAGLTFGYLLGALTATALAQVFTQVAVQLVQPLLQPLLALPRMAMVPKKQKSLKAKRHFSSLLVWWL